MSVYIFFHITMVQSFILSLSDSAKSDRKHLLEPSAFQGDLVSSAGFVLRVSGTDCSSQTTRHNGDSTVCSGSEPFHRHNLSSQYQQHTCRYQKKSNPFSCILLHPVKDFYFLCMLFRTKSSILSTFRRIGLQIACLSLVSIQRLLN